MNPFHFQLRLVEMGQCLHTQPPCELRMPVPGPAPRLPERGQPSTPCPPPQESPSSHSPSTNGGHGLVLRAPPSVSLNPETT